MGVQEIFVDMHTHCRNNETATKDRKLFWETTGFCFLCLKESSLKNNKLGTREASPKNIFSHLVVNPFCIFLNSLKDSLVKEGEDETSYLRDKYDFSLVLCVTCSSFAYKLSKVIRYTEDLVKMIIDYQLDNFHQILRASDEKSESYRRWNSFQDTMIVDCLKQAEDSLVKKLKQRTKERCIAKVKELTWKSLPRVVLPRLRNENQTNAPSQLTNASDMGILYDPENNIVMHEATTLNVDSGILTDTSSSQNDRSRTASNYPIPTPSPSPTTGSAGPSKAQKPLVKHRHSKQFKKKAYKVLAKHCITIAEKDGFHCTICNNFDKVRIRPAILSHLANIHPETFFTHRQFRDLSNKAFKSCCRKALSSITWNSKVIQIVESGNKRQKLLCSICNSECANRRALRYHMMKWHYKLLNAIVDGMQTLHCRVRSK